ncbi:glycerophosphodiester phosphodiesterase [Planomicrobium sp. MB-3u-38]|nr:glycerophosphodiester phosphodiesterase [Planomicrobium sp. MB-3u-38]PKH11158.1 glycerophosphodiester phosphodiesterase [Planomicrobium sp. MB-3u-38]
MNPLKKISYSLVILLMLILVFLLYLNLKFGNGERSTLNSNEILNVAHRGASGHAPEHTLAAYELGEQMKGDFIEVDLQMTEDGVLIAMHDEKVDRTTDGSGFVKDMTLDEIKQLDAGSWFNEAYPDKAKPEYAGLTVPTLEEIIEEFGRGSRYYIETKGPDVYPEMQEELLRVLYKHKLIGSNAASSKVLVQSFSADSLLEMHELDPEIPLIQLISYSEPATITDQEISVIKEYALGIGTSYTSIDKEYVEKIRENELLIHPFLVNSKADMERLLDWGVTGMFTNFPDRLDEVLKSRGD